MVAISGASGFIGCHLTTRLNDGGHEIRALRRGETNVDGATAVIHLAGENIAQRWTKAAKERIRASRIGGTRALVSAIAAATDRPSALLCASAVGIYGSRGDEVLTEASSRGSGFLSDLADEWEAAGSAAKPLGVRVVHLRFGVVLGRDGGAYPKMARPFRYGVGGRLGSGRQWMPWIHIDDVVNLIAFALEDDASHGPVNVTSPNSATNADFTRSLAGSLHRPGFMRVPRFALKLVLGEMSDALLSSTRALPEAALAAGFKFRYPDLDLALAQLASPKMGESS